MNSKVIAVGLTVLFVFLAPPFRTPPVDSHASAGDRTSRLARHHLDTERGARNERDRDLGGLARGAVDFGDRGDVNRRERRDAEAARRDSLHEGPAVRPRLARADVARLVARCPR